MNMTIAFKDIDVCLKRHKNKNKYYYQVYILDFYFAAKIIYKSLFACSNNEYVYFDMFFITVIYYYYYSIMRFACTNIK